MYERHFVDVFGQVRKDLRHPLAALAVLSELEGRFHQPSDGVGEKAGEAIESRQFLTVASGQLGLVVPRIHVAGTTVDEQPDDALRPGGEVRFPWRQRIGRGRRQKTFFRQQRGQADQAGPTARSLQPLPTRPEGRMVRMRFRESLQQPVFECVHDGFSADIIERERASSGPLRIVLATRAASTCFAAAAIDREQTWPFGSIAS